jgi:hypothetical protein
LEVLRDEDAAFFCKGKRMLSAEELSALPQGFVWLAWAVFALGGFICLINFAIFMKWVSYRLRKTKPENYRTISAIPILGSLLVALMLKTLGSIPAAKVTGIILILIDSGGILWGLAGIPYIVYRAIRKRLRKSTTVDESAGARQANRDS